MVNSSPQVITLAIDFEEVVIATNGQGSCALVFGNVSGGGTGSVIGGGHNGSNITFTSNQAGIHSPKNLTIYT